MGYSHLIWHKRLQMCDEIKRKWKSKADWAGTFGSISKLFTDEEIWKNYEYFLTDLGLAIFKKRKICLQVIKRKSPLPVKEVATPALACIWVLHVERVCVSHSAVALITVPSELVILGRYSDSCFQMSSSLSATKREWHTRLSCRSCSRRRCGESQGRLNSKKVESSG